MHAPKSILIIDHDREIPALLASHLRREGYSILTAHDGHAGLDLAQRRGPALIIVDSTLPQLDGWELCRAVRLASSVPILLLSASRGANECVQALAMGADDYVAKPFSPEEVVARVKAILRRAATVAHGEMLSHQEVVLDLHKRRLRLRGQPIAVTRLEYRLLAAMMAAPGRVFLREELLRHLYCNGEVVVDRVIDVHIANLRRKIEDIPAKPRYILTARGLGYQFTDEPATTAPRHEPGSTTARQVFVARRLGGYNARFFAAARRE